MPSSAAACFRHAGSSTTRCQKFPADKNFLAAVASFLSLLVVYSDSKTASGWIPVWLINYCSTRGDCSINTNTRSARILFGMLDTTTYLLYESCRCRRRLCSPQVRNHLETRSEEVGVHFVGRGSPPRVNSWADEANYRNTKRAQKLDASGQAGLLQLSRRSSLVSMCYCMNLSYEHPDTISHY